MRGMESTGGFIRKGLEVRRSLCHCRDEKEIK